VAASTKAHAGLTRSTDLAGLSGAGLPDRRAFRDREFRQ
jgi:hypothetical protein